MAQHPVLSYAVPTGDGGEPLEGRIEVNEAERAKLAEFLGLETLDGFIFDYRLEPFSAERYRLTGTIGAALTQLCVVTLEPVSEIIDETVCVECWPEDEIDQDKDGEAEDAGEGSLPEDPPVPIVGGKIDLGAFAAEVLASSINPYPRKEGVAFDWQDSKNGAGEKSESPFAKLAALKSKK